MNCEGTLARRRPRVVVSKLGLNGSDRVAKTIGGRLMDVGVEVIDAKPTDGPEQIVRAAIDADADAIGLSILSRDDLALIALVLDLLEGAEIPVAVGGALSVDDVARLKRLGVTAMLMSGGAVEDFAMSLRCGADRAPNQLQPGRS